jgi:hypothetical protein
MPMFESEERYCHQVLAELRRSYELQAKPYIDRLVAIQCLRPPPPLVLTLDKCAGLRDDSVIEPTLQQAASDPPEVYRGECDA